MVNKYAILDSLQEESEAFQTHSRASEVALSRNKTKCPPNVTKRKTVIIGDSHATSIAAEISSGLGKDFEVTGTVTPGARLENITNLADKVVSTIGKSDTVVVMGGAIEVSKKEANIGLKVKKGKAVPLQAWSGPEGSRKLRFPDFMTTAQDGGKVVSLMHQPPLPPGNTPGTHFC